MAEGEEMIGEQRFWCKWNEQKNECEIEKLEIVDVKGSWVTYRNANGVTYKQNGLGCGFPDVLEAIVAFISLASIGKPYPTEKIRSAVKLSMQFGLWIERGDVPEWK